MTELVVKDVSDTARWTAFIRAQESARSDALFIDPMAEKLAGARGKEIAAGAPRLARPGVPIVIRTRLIDELIEQSISAGCDRVINLAAGFDARPYRLELPPELVWIEADLPKLIEEKNSLLASETPRCQLSRVSVDLADSTARTKFLIQATADATKTLVITEGLLIYLAEDDVKSLSQDLAQLQVAWWIADLVSPAILRKNMRWSGKSMNNAPMKFAPSRGLDFFRHFGGWSAADVRSVFKAGVEWKRLPLAARLFVALVQPDPRRRNKGSWAVVTRFTLSNVASPETPASET